MFPRKNLRQAAIIAGFRSGLEQDIQLQLARAKIGFEYESVKLPYVIPASDHLYTPDFVLANGIIIETKGRWILEDRKKIKLVKEQHPDLDLRMVFTNSKSKIRRGAKSCYQDCCRRLGIPFADKEVPVEWLKEKINKKSKKIIETMRKKQNDKNR